MCVCAHACVCVCVGVHACASLCRACALSRIQRAHARAHTHTNTHTHTHTHTQLRVSRLRAKCNTRHGLPPRRLKVAWQSFNVHKLARLSWQKAHLSKYETPKANEQVLRRMCLSALNNLITTQTSHVTCRPWPFGQWPYHACRHVLPAPPLSVLVSWVVGLLFDTVSASQSCGTCRQAGWFNRDLSDLVRYSWNVVTKCS